MIPSLTMEAQQFWPDSNYYYFSGFICSPFVFCLNAFLCMICH
uniref:Uncharacterized protein n=1 Tax=Rhizophora mucronata TaxID=61149 RepID=A0A2P2J0R3_RHIMU